MSVTTLQGGILVSKATIIKLLCAVQHKPLTAESTLFHAGMEEQKRQIALMQQQEFRLTASGNPAADLVRSLKE